MGEGLGIVYVVIKPCSVISNDSEKSSSPGE